MNFEITCFSLARYFTQQEGNFSGDNMSAVVFRLVLCLQEQEIRCNPGSETCMYRNQFGHHSNRSYLQPFRKNWLLARLLGTSHTNCTFTQDAKNRSEIVVVFCSSLPSLPPPMPCLLWSSSVPATGPGVPLQPLAPLDGRHGSQELVFKLCCSGRLWSDGITMGGGLGGGKWEETCSARYLSRRSPWTRGSKQEVARGSALRPTRRCLEEKGKIKFAKKRTSPFGVIF
jgi:hypothetical protein